MVCLLFSYGFLMVFLRLSCGFPATGDIRFSFPAVILWFSCDIPATFWWAQWYLPFALKRGSGFLRFPAVVLRFPVFLRFVIMFLLGPVTLTAPPGELLQVRRQAEVRQDAAPLEVPAPLLLVLPREADAAGLRAHARHREEDGRLPREARPAACFRGRLRPARGEQREPGNAAQSTCGGGGGGYWSGVGNGLLSIITDAGLEIRHRESLFGITAAGQVCGNYPPQIRRAKRAGFSAVLGCSFWRKSLKTLRKTSISAPEARRFWEAWEAPPALFQGGGG